MLKTISNKSKIFKRKYEKKFRNIWEKNQRNNTLLHRNVPQANVLNKDHWLVNLTTVSIPPNVKKVLELGPKFIIPYSSTNLNYELVADCDYIVRNVTTDINERDIMTSNIVELLKSEFELDRKINNGIINSNDFRETLEFLDNEKQLVVTKADKSNTTVVLSNDDYDVKMKALLDDGETYSMLSRDHTSSLERKSNNLVSTLYKNGCITDAQRSKLVRHNAIAPKIYGVVKIHKPGCPLRPVVSTINSPIYNLSRYMGTILRDLKDKDNFNFKNSFEIREVLKTLHMHDEFVFVSLDVVSMFTSIPLDLAISLIMERWDNELSILTNVPKVLFEEILLFVLQNGYFVYRDKIVKQTNGLAMGDPLSPIICDIVLDSIFHKIREHYNNYLKFMAKYVDDSLIYIHNSKKDEILNFVNTIHPKIKFTPLLTKFCEKYAISMLLRNV